MSIEHNTLTRESDVNSMGSIIKLTRYDVMFNLMGCDVIISWIISKKKVMYKPLCSKYHC